MKPELAIGMLEQRRAVEVTEAVLVGGEVRGDPIEIDADALAMQRIDHPHQLLGIAIARGRAEVASGLVAPRSEEWMLGQWHQLDVREAEPLDVLDELRRELGVRKGSIAVL